VVTQASVLITCIGWALFRQTLEPSAIAGIALIVLGVFVLHLSRAGHA
jgi:multidrug transporter EmrE-like cation transporter